MFKTMLQSKTIVKEIWTFQPSSKKCIECGNIKKDLKLSDRIYYCDKCWHIEDRDLMASKNILAMEQDTKI
jgi:putative transposase